MLAEHNRTGPALAANPATFPLNDVVYLLSRAIQLTSAGSKTRVFPDMPHHPTAARASGMNPKAAPLVELDGIEPTT